MVETEKSKSGAGGKKGGEDVKKIDNTKWWGGDLKDIYTDRRKKKVDYLEVSDIEESDGDDGEEEKKKTKKKDPSIQKKNLNKESRISSTSDEDSDKEENLQKKKSVEKKPQKKEVAVVEKKRQSGSQPKSIAVQIFKGKRKEESSEDEESPTKEKNLESLAKDARKRKSETLPVSEESPLSKSTKKKAPPLAKTTAREKMVTSDSEPEIVKKDMIKIEDDSEEKSASLAEHDLLSNQIREKLLSNKSEKVTSYSYNHCWLVSDVFLPHLI